MKIVEFFLIIWGKLSELEPEPEFLTSWSLSGSRNWSRTKMDRLRNTAFNYNFFAKKIVSYENHNEITHFDGFF
jgi:hypothetical protein